MSDFLTNNAGTITDTYAYDAFGMQIVTTQCTYCERFPIQSGEWPGLVTLASTISGRDTRIKPPDDIWSRDPVSGTQAAVVAVRVVGPGPR